MTDPYDHLTPAQKQSLADEYNKDHKDPPIGDAFIDKDGTIHMTLRRAGLIHVDSTVNYKKDSQYYEDVLHHLGGLKIGEVKLVAPFPDDFGTKK